MTEELTPVVDTEPAAVNGTLDGGGEKYTGESVQVLRDAAHTHASGSLAWILSENTGDVELRTFFVEPFTDHSRREQRELTQSRISIASEIKEFNDSLHAQIVQRQIGLNI